MNDFLELGLMFLGAFLAAIIFYWVTSALWGPEVSMLIAIFGTIFLNLLRLTRPR